MLQSFSQLNEKRVINFLNTRVCSGGESNQRSDNDDEIDQQHSRLAESLPIIPMHTCLDDGGKRQAQSRQTQCAKQLYQNKTLILFNSAIRGLHAINQFTEMKSSKLGIATASKTVRNNS